jgi:hypothetical protein
MKPSVQKILTKLGNQKVDLSRIEDLIFSAKTSKATIEQAVEFLKEAEPLVQAAANRITEYENWIDITLKEFGKINQDAKDLGVSPKDIKGYNEAEQFFSKAKQLKSTYDGLNKMIKSNRR